MGRGLRQRLGRPPQAGSGRRECDAALLGLVGEDPPAVEGADRHGARRATAGPLAWHGGVVSSWTDAMERGGQADLHGIRPAPAPAAVARRGSHAHPLCWLEGRRRTGSGAHTQAVPGKRTRGRKREGEGGCSVQTPFVSSKTLRNRVYATQVIYIKVVVLRSLYLFQSGYLDRKCMFREI